MSFSRQVNSDGDTLADVMIEATEGIRAELVALNENVQRLTEVLERIGPLLPTAEDVGE